jgi:flagellar operon protein
MNTQIGSIRPQAPEVRGPRTPETGAPGFADQLNALQQPQAAMPTTSAQASTPLKFSNHAVDRMQSRGIRFSPEDMGKIQNAVSKAASKGSKNALLITDNAALIVSVKDKAVVTVMDKASLKDNVFTNIDSTVMV